MFDLYAFFRVIWEQLTNQTKFPCANNDAIFSSVSNNFSTKKKKNSLLYTKYNWKLSWPLATRKWENEFFFVGA